MYSYLTKLQTKIANKVTVCPLKISEIKLTAGIDISFEKSANMGFCCISVFNKSMEIVEEQFACGVMNMPYIPGLLSFRELPLIYRAFCKLKTNPDIFILDSQGIAHPRFLGLASHFGVVFDKISIGCAKKKLVGDFVMPDSGKGSYSILNYKGRSVGAVLRTKNNTKPVFVSPGNKINTGDSISSILMFTDKYKIPEPTRRAHIASNKYRKETLNQTEYY